MRVHLDTGLMHVLQRRAGELELATGLERQRGVVLAQPDDVLPLHDGLPAEALHAFEKHADAGAPEIRERLIVFQPVDELLVLRADPPILLRFGAARDMLDEIVTRRDRAARGLRNGHAFPLPRSRFALTEDGLPEPSGPSSSFQRQSPQMACQIASAAKA